MKNKYIDKIKFIINSTDFHELLVKGIVSSVDAFSQNTENEKIYAIGLYTSGEYSYLNITGNTLEGLKEKAIEYKKIPTYQNSSLDDLEIELKWSGHSQKSGH